MKPLDDMLTEHGATLSRRGFIAAGGALAVCLATRSGSADAAGTGSPDATKPASWFEIRADNTIIYHTGKCDFGQSTIYTAYPQIIAEELGFPFEAVVQVVSGDTDRTPDGGGTFGMLRTNALNLRKAAAYTREAVLELAATRFGVAKSALSIKDGTITGGGKSATYGQLIQGQQLKLTIPTRGNVMDFAGLVVDGNPPLKPTSTYTVVGKPFKNPSLRPKMTGQVTWATDVKLPGMLHARTIHPPTLGSKLIKAGTLDQKTYPGARVVVIGNLVGVLSPNQWEAIQASYQVAADTKWTEWKGLPGHEKLFDHMRNSVDWKAIPPASGSANKGDVAKAATVKTHTGSYGMPFFKHAPIGPSVAVADVRPDGSVTVHTHTQNPQFLRRGIALMLGTGAENVVIRTYPGTGHYGRSNGGNSGAEDEAVLYSKAVGRPVRVQWMRADDMQWSTQSNAALCDIRIGLDAQGRIASYQADHYAPPMQDDRQVGALLAGLPAFDPPGLKNEVSTHRADARMVDRWLYGAITNSQETAHSMFQIGEKESPTHFGLRCHSMRTPVQFQQNFPREVAMSEAAALAGADPIQFRIDHTTDPRVKALLIRLREEDGWTPRASPNPEARAAGEQPVRGRGVSLMLRENGYWACAAHIAVIPATGEVKVERVTLVVDPGIAVNPLQLKRQAQAGCTMGISEALHEEVTFDESAVTNADWTSYPILNISELPDLKVVIAATPESGVYGQGSESANALAGSAMAAAVLDATGRPIRRLPLRPDYVKQAMNT